MGVGIEIKNIENEGEFRDVLSLDKLVIYFTVNWSGPERASRSILNKVLEEVESNKIPFFKVDASEQNLKFAETWILNQSQDVELNYGGWGEVLLVERGKIKDYIQYPAKLGLEGTIKKIRSWFQLE